MHAQAGPFLAPTEEDRAEARRRRPRFTLGDAAALAEALLGALGEEAPRRQPAGIPDVVTAAQQLPGLPLLSTPAAAVVQPAQANLPAGIVASQGAQQVPAPRLLLPAPDAAVHSLPAARQQQLPEQGLLPSPPMIVQPGLAAIPQLSARRPPAVQPLLWPPGAAFLPRPSTAPAVSQPGPSPPGMPPPALGSPPLPASMAGAYPGSLPLQQPPQQQLARPALPAGSAAPAADSGALPQTHGAASLIPTPAALIWDPPAAPQLGAPPEQQQDAERPAPMELDAAGAPPAPVVSEPLASREQVTAASSEAAAVTVTAASEPPPAPATVLSEGRAAVLDALDRALGIMPPSAAGDGPAFGAQSAVPSFATPAWLPSPLPTSAFPVMGGLGPPFSSVMHPPGRAPPSQMPAGVGPPGSVPAAVGGVRRLTLDRGAVMDEEIRRLRADMAERARAQEERERRLAEVWRRSTARCFPRTPLRLPDCACREGMPRLCHAGAAHPALSVLPHTYTALLSSCSAASLPSWRGPRVPCRALPPAVIGEHNMPQGLVAVTTDHLQPQADALAEAEAEAEAALDDYSSDEYELPAGHIHRKRKRVFSTSGPKQPKVKAPPPVPQVRSQHCK